MTTEITIDRLPPGTNKLERMHWATKKKKISTWMALIRSKTRHAHEGCVDVYFTTHRSRFLDVDNHAASAKIPLDALVRTGIIKEDNPKVITNYYPNQIKCKRKDERTVIRIEDVKCIDKRVV